MEIFLFPLGGALAGFIIAYFLNLFGVLVVTVLVVALIGYELYRQRGQRKSSGTLGAALIALMTLVPFFLVLWIGAFMFNNELILPQVGNLLGWLKSTFIR